MAAKVHSESTLSTADASHLSIKFVLLKLCSAFLHLLNKARQHIVVDGAGTATAASSTLMSKFELIRRC